MDIYDEMDGRPLYPLRFIPVPSVVEGDLYTLADIGYVDSVVASGWLAGNTLSELMETYLENLSGETGFEFFGTQFPLMVRTLDLKEDLPLMLNPSDEVAADRYDTFGKTALWYVADAEPGARLWIGFKEGVTSADFYSACLDGSVRGLLNEVVPKKGESFLIAPGTVFCAGKGLGIVEIAQASGLSFILSCRVRQEGRNDFGGPDLEEAFDLVEYVPAGQSRLVPGPSNGTVVPLFDNGVFAVNRLDLSDPLRITAPQYGTFVIYHCVKGEVSVQVRPDPSKGAGEIERFPLKAGQTMLIPAEVEEYYLVPTGRDTLLLEALMSDRTDAVKEGSSLEEIERSLDS